MEEAHAFAVVFFAPPRPSPSSLINDAANLPLTPTNEDDNQDQGTERLYSEASQSAPICCVVYRTKSCNKKDFVRKEIKCYTVLIWL
jgi:hypothetical protein